MLSTSRNGVVTLGTSSPAVLPKNLKLFFPRGSRGSSCLYSHNRLEESYLREKHGSMVEGVSTNSMRLRLVFETLLSNFKCYRAKHRSYYRRLPTEPTTFHRERRRHILKFIFPPGYQYQPELEMKTSYYYIMTRAESLSKRKSARYDEIVKKKRS